MKDVFKDGKIFADKEDFKKKYQEMFISELGRDYDASPTIDRYEVLAKLISNSTKEAMARTKKEGRNMKKVYYFSMEFLIGKLLDNYLLNLGVTDIVKEGLADLGIDLEDLKNVERDPGLGNGGLGRLAACYLDSMAALGIHGNGIGIRYKYGLFKQTINSEGRQVEVADDWLENGFPWETKKIKNAVKVKFGGRVDRHMEGDNLISEWVDADEILAVPYDVPIVGYGGEVVNTLRLWSAKPVEDKFDMNAFNAGDYSGAVKNRADIEAITTLLYPDDSKGLGKLLRLKQEYMFVAAGLSTITSDFKKAHPGEWSKFPDYVAIQINDTHPSLVSPELLRILIDQEGLAWDEAYDIVVKSVSYTNHTILPESLEKWDIDMFQSLLPRVYDFVEEIDRRYKESFDRTIPDWHQVLQNTAILWDGKVKMANMSIIAGSHVNGVAKLHSDILKDRVLKDFYTVYPEKFSNKTNGISHRRFLCEANPEYTAIIKEAIGDGFIVNPDELKKLTKFEEQKSFLEKAEKVKKSNKERLAKYIMETSGVAVDTNSVFDIQVKRFHAYKRQLLNIFKVMYLYDRLVNEPGFDVEPTTFIFAGKAAQGYEFAKESIRLINNVAAKINNDPRVQGKIKVAFIPNFSVSNGQLIYPAADISEQISTAGYEASGTGNMKFMMNGAITLATLDGSTVEIADLVGPEHISIFGLSAERVEQYKREHNYFAEEIYFSNPYVNRILDSIKGEFPGIFNSLLRFNDEYFVLKDFESYVNAWTELTNKHKDSYSWYKTSVHNTAMSGFFSSDRSISEYAKDIWHV